MLTRIMVAPLATVPTAPQVDTAPRFSSAPATAVGPMIRIAIATTTVCAVATTILTFMATTPWATCQHRFVVVHTRVVGQAVAIALLHHELPCAISRATMIA